MSNVHFNDFKNVFLNLDVAAEKTEKALIAGIEHFDPSKLKHTETQEKNPLPDKEGMYIHMHLNVICVNMHVSFCLMIVFAYFRYAQVI